MPKAAKRQKTEEAEVDENVAPDDDDFLVDEGDALDAEADHDAASDIEDGGPEQEGTGPAGTISRVHVVNFMNHENLHMSLCPGMNYVIGKNGSGKSAMAHAAQVALGATARETQRGKSMGKFVRTGQPSALVSLEIRNTPEVDAWEHELYGDKIIIERRILAAGGGSYSLKNASGKKVSGKRDDLQRMLDHYNIQVNNPCSVLGQDESKKLAGGKPEEKYDFYLKASGLKAVLDQLRETNEKKKMMHGSKTRQEVQVNEFKRVWEAFEKEYDENEQLRNLESQMQQFKEELVWSHVHNARDDATEKEKNAADMGVEIDEVQSNVDGIEQKISELEPEMAALEKRVKHFEQDSSADQQQLAKLNGAAKEAKERVKAQAKTVARLTRDQKAKEKETKDLQEQIQERQNQPQQQGNGDQESGRKAQMAQMHKLQQEKEKTDEDFKRLQQELQVGKDEVRAFEGTEKDAKRAIDAQRNQVRQEKSQLQYLSNNSSNVNSKFGSDVSRMMDAIEKNARKFKVKPVGPVGAFINVKDAQWATAVEAAIGGGNLATILIHCKEDEQTLDKLIKQNKINKFAINYMKTSIDGRSYRETGQLKRQTYPDSRFTNVMDVIEVTHPAVENFLYDNLSYQNLLFVSREEASHVMWPKNKNQRQRNVKSGYEKDGLRLWMTGNTQMQSSTYTKQLLGSDNSSAINAQTQKVQQAEQRVQQIEAEWDDKMRFFVKGGKKPKERYQALQKLFTANQKRAGQLGRALDDVRDELAEGQDEEDDEAAILAEIEDLKSQMHQAQDDVEQLSSEIETAQRELDTLQGAHTAAEDTVQRFEVETEAKHDNSAEDYTKMEQLGKRLDKLHRNKKNELSKHREKRVALKNLEKESEQLRKEALAQEKKAVEFCDGNGQWEQEFEARGGKHHSTEWLENKIKQIENRLQKAAEKKGGRTLDEITLDRDRSNNQYLACKNAFDLTTKTLAILSKGIKKRGKTYKDFRRSTAHMARKMFNRCMNKKGHSGDLKFDHKDGALNLECQLNVETSESGGRKVSNTRTLSGGEKSFTTLSLLLALGAVTSVPFAIFDEIDVYMDDVNRKVTLQALQDEARERNGSRQYCVLTPQDLTGIKTDADTQILRMPEQERMTSD